MVIKNNSKVETMLNKTIKSNFEDTILIFLLNRRKLFNYSTITMLIFSFKYYLNILVIIQKISFKLYINIHEGKKRKKIYMVRMTQNKGTTQECDEPGNEETCLTSADRNIGE